jgi:hypothetical protein
VINRTSEQRTCFYLKFLHTGHINYNLELPSTGHVIYNSKLSHTDHIIYNSELPSTGHVFNSEFPHTIHNNVTIQSFRVQAMLFTVLNFHTQATIILQFRASEHGPCYFQLISFTHNPHATIFRIQNIHTQTMLFSILNFHTQATIMLQFRASEYRPSYF